MPPTAPHCRVVVTGDDVWEDLTTALEQTRIIATAADMVVSVESGLARLTAQQPTPRSPRPDGPDVVVLLTAAGEFTPDQQKRVNAMVRAGMGLLAIHCSAFFPGLNTDAPRPGADGYWSTAFNLLGVRYDSHGPLPHDTTFTVRLSSDHPITAGLDDFPITHEHYHMVLAEQRPHVLAWRDSACGPEPIMTAKDWGAGRVVYLQLGHDMRTFGEPAVRELISRALTWVAPSTRRSCLDAPAEHPVSLECEPGHERATCVEPDVCADPTPQHSTTLGGEASR
ncbi:MAG: ThuA domain-containing protein [Propionibacteriaceae bacterium]|jgi:type 1 glutamine amidotransferase|nr:ThuA domain-containing protein [Propionibacteriaceae bacterium]